MNYLNLDEASIKKLNFRRIKTKFVNIIHSEIAEEFLESLLILMQIMFNRNKDFKKNIEDFDCKLVFRDISGSILISVVFENSTMKTKEEEVQNPNATIIFKNQKTLMDYLFSPKSNVLSALLNSDITFKGNLNYLSKFAYMATHLKLMLIS